MSKVVIVTGGSKGIGAAVCRAFVNEGDTVVINYSRSQSDAEALLSELSGAKGRAVIEKADISNASDAKRMVDNTMKNFNKIDVLVNNAGITRDGFLMLMNEEDWRDVMDVNLKGVFNCSKAVCEHMIAQRGGVIINMASLSGITGLAGQTNYAASKGGVIAFTKALAKELAPFGVRVNAVAPGVIETEMTGGLSDDAKKYFLDTIPMKRFGSAAEVASVVRFLCSDDASYITGETLTISGGLP
jgi:3-oxoacyl-[acyl-carrier protein] reductase